MPNNIVPDCSLILNPIYIITMQAGFAIDGPLDQCDNPVDVYSELLFAELNATLAIVCQFGVLDFQTTVKIVIATLNSNQLDIAVQIDIATSNGIDIFAPVLYPLCAEDINLQLGATINLIPDDASKCPNATGNLTKPDETFSCKPGEGGISYNSDPNYCVECPAGTFSNGSHCVRCQAGTYQSETLQTKCLLCPNGTSNVGEGNKNIWSCEGSYSAAEGATSCARCPESQSTINTASNSMDDCYDICQPGHFSITGLNVDPFGTCQPCPLNFYQNESRAVTCIECPLGTGTRYTGNVNEAQCEEPEIIAVTSTSTDTIAEHNTTTVISPSQEPTNETRMNSSSERRCENVRQAGQPAPLHDGDENIVPNEYIVATSSVNATSYLTSVLESYGVVIFHSYEFLSFTGFSMNLSDSNLFQFLQNSTDVCSITANSYVLLNYTIHDDNATTVHNSWGHRRIWQREKLEDNQTPQEDTGAAEAGECVVVYVIDTGIDFKNADFKNVPKPENNITNRKTVSDSDDCDFQGHGTRVAGIINSIANKATLVDVKAFRDIHVLKRTGELERRTPEDKKDIEKCKGEYKWDDLIEAIEFAKDDCKKRRMKKKENENKELKCVINFSIEAGAPGPDGFTKIVNEVIKKCDISFVTGAGNSGKAASGTTPANIKCAITVGATNKDDKLADFSNYGECVDILAPGEDVPTIVSKKIKDPNCKDPNASGTSFAAAHVAGVIARYLGNQLQLPEDKRKCTWKEISDWLCSVATCNKIAMTPEAFFAWTPNRLLNKG